jgi:hypothetical protein
MLYRANGNSETSRPRQPRRSYRDSAVARAVAGAQLWKGQLGAPRTQAQAARLVGSTPLYVAAAAAVIDAKTPGLIERVLRGHVGLLAAAESIRRQVRLVKAYRQADRNDRKAFCKTIGVDNVFDELVAPLL